MNQGGGVGFGVQTTTTSEEKAHNAFNQALHTIQLAASSVLETLNTLNERPDTARLDFAIRFDAEAKAMDYLAEIKKIQVKRSR